MPAIHPTPRLGTSLGPPCQDHCHNWTQDLAQGCLEKRHNSPKGHHSVILLCTFKQMNLISIHFYSNSTYGRSHKNELSHVIQQIPEDSQPEPQPWGMWLFHLNTASLAQLPRTQSFTGVFSAGHGNQGLGMLDKNSSYAPTFISHFPWQLIK